MSLFHGLETSASALTSQRLRMDVVSSNMANQNSTRATMNEDGDWEPYRRRMTSMSPNESNFQNHFNHALGRATETGQGVRVDGIVEDETPFQEVYRPEHPDADEDGYVQMPNVDPLKEMIDLMSATRSYEANVTAMDANKNMMLKGLEIGQQ
ncbi:flagellar basal-body rod protein FlgC [Salsuginibacillus halophilus]|uniref:Flagellar basal-body rod protein FlgC n=1 Tax=Salsuginibacillus halophilus TaxID=517424 RepID=A0A2P8HYD6_9BACI|nr:flagellar basal body rod protein FlgC [Salsuginibacillus halophilus]PSL51185.1 flagellar basal-body rod protein FlgC [Salsuginibacillus halophilus]